MSQEKSILIGAVAHPDFLVFASLFVAGTVTLAIKKRRSPLTVGALVGETILASGTAFLCWIAGLYQGLDAMQIVLLALPAAYGQVSMVLRLMQHKEQKFHEQN